MKQLVTTLVFLRRGNELLLAMKKRGHGQGHWNGAGGKVAAGETFEQAMIRECQEEIGVTPVEYQKTAELSFYEPHGNEPSEVIAHAYLCSSWQGEPTESEEMEPRWFALDDIPYDHMWPDDRYWLVDMLAGKRLRAVFHYNDDNALISHEITEVEQFA
ncbi:MAG TPA: 8-oxo-dGTP diphosphatase [Candidatus Saccharimonadales bacterium]|nr:8-oxo-dGTP diphosphatase [Candidatus Saccharimonadales bacterium]